MLTAEQILDSLTRAEEEGRSLALVSRLDPAGAAPAPRLLFDQDGARRGTLGAEALDAAAERAARELMAAEREEIAVVSVDDQRLLIEIARPRFEMIVCGGGHVGRAVAAAARLLGFEVTVIDDRAEFASRERFPDPQVRLVAGDFTAALGGLRVTPATHIVIVTRGHRHDEICLREVIEKPARYIGMIGSRRRTTTIRERMRRAGVAAEHLRRVHAPIGLDIGAVTPEEIALSILAEIVLLRRGGSGRPKGEAGPMRRARDGGREAFPPYPVSGTIERFPVDNND